MSFGVSKLGILAEIRTGKLDSNAAIENGKYPFFTCDPTTLRIDKYAFDQEAVLLAGNNANANYTTKYYSGKFNAYQRTYVIKSNDETVLLTRFLAFALAQSLAKLKSLSIGTSTKYLTKGILDNLEIPLPTLCEQRKIIDTLSTYESLIENNREQIKLLEEAAQRLYKEWFVDFRFPGHETVEIDFETGLPKEWAVKNLLAEISFVRGKSYTAENLSRESGQQLINLSNIAPFGGWMPGGEKPYSGDCRPDQIVSSGDVLLAVTDMTKERRLVGHASMIPRKLAGSVISMDLIKLVPNNLERSYLYCWLRFSGISSMISMLANGTNVLHLKPEALNRVSILVPCLSMQKAFSHVVSPIFTMMDCLQEQIEELLEARDRLVPRLMEGNND